MISFAEPGVIWPPPDPDRMPRRIRALDPSDAFTHQERSTSNEEQIEAFRRRQEEDLRRRSATGHPDYRRRPFHVRYDSDQLDASDIFPSPAASGEEAWRNSEGDRLNDFGVDEDAEFYDEESIPLAELLRRRRGEQHSKVS